ncbi:MAG: 50S ribosomal protein L6 [Cellvibrionales bacterium TMED49]|nr:50S ribosomal protein L6 [Porticoccaceae bacterium]OUU39220.1 MAG: 50S ribosomal protein L6 [Cellvibrionales bacterium TMED49]
MSRIAKNPIKIPDGVKVVLSEQVISVSGAKGTLKMDLNSEVEVRQTDALLTFEARTKSKFSNAMSGTTRALINNMVIGVTEGWEKKIELVGVGYRAQIQGETINLSLGFSHPVLYQLPEGVTAEIPSQTELVLRSSSKQKIGQVAAEIRSLRPPEPYKGKGIRVDGERIRRKEAKKK